MTENEVPMLGPADPAFKLEDYVLYNLVRATATYSAAMAAALKEHGLDLTKWRILMLLDDSSPAPVSDLARRAVIKMPTITKMLNRMESEGLIKRDIFETDRRVVHVSMTPKSARVLQTVKMIGQRVFDRAFMNISDSETGQMARTLKKLRENLDRSPYTDDLQRVG